MDYEAQTTACRAIEQVHLEQQALVLHKHALHVVAKTWGWTEVRQMESYYIMHRTGQFKPLRFSSNQCKAPRHEHYHYELAMVFDGQSELDENKFLLDHQDVDNLMQGLKLGGSCEQMHKKISTSIRNLMEARKLPMVACRCTIRPTIPDGPAYMKFVSFEPGYQHCVALV